MSDIRPLSASVINKIAAGEVIERPASVVKELVENALDAGARRVEVALAAGGLELVRVVDDGGGIPADQLPLAVASHATSKIRDADDLFRVGTLGFRGEALASIAEVSRLVLRSRTAATTAGAELVVDGGRAEPIAPCGCPVGTVVEVRNLFFNTPVRRKFLRTTSTELGHATEAFTRLALAHPHVAFRLAHGDRVAHDLPATDDPRERIAALLGPEIAAALIAVDSDDDQARLTGYVCDPSQSRSHNRLQYLFLNGRHIRDRALQHALGEAYRGLLMTGRYPICVLRLSMSPELVDVNVHPTKLEVRFQDGGRLYSQLLGALRKKFLSADLTARVALGAAHGAPAADPTGAHDTARAEQQRSELVAWARGESAAPAPASVGGGPQLWESAEAPSPRDGGLSLVRLDRSWPAARRWAASDAASRVSAEPPPETTRQPTSEHRPPVRATALQVHNRYLVAETAEGMVVIDQHALHERILYEQLRQRMLHGRLESQRLLAPEPVHLSADEAAAALEARDVLAQLGLEIEPFGGETILIASYPAMLANLPPAEVLRQALERLLASGGKVEPRDLLDELLHMLACKAAIKAGDRLAPDEIEALLAHGAHCHDAHHCPHGRPTSLVLTRDELDKRFKRI